MKKFMYKFRLNRFLWLFLCCLIFAVMLFSPHFVQASTENCNSRLQMINENISTIERFLAPEYNYDRLNKKLNVLKDAVDSLESQVQFLRQNTECHTLKPPSLDRLSDICNKIKSDQDQTLSRVKKRENLWQIVLQIHSQANMTARNKKVNDYLRIRLSVSKVLKIFESSIKPLEIPFDVFAEKFIMDFKPTGVPFSNPYIQIYKNAIISRAKKSFLRQNPDSDNLIMRSRKHAFEFTKIFMDELISFTQEEYDVAYRKLSELPTRSSIISWFNDELSACKRIFLIEQQFWTPSTSTASAVDNQGPDLSITSHNQIMPWSRVATRSITLSGAATDMNRGDNGIQSVYINSSLADSGSTATGNGTANWSEVLKLSSGWNQITVEAHDNSSNYNKTKKVIWIYLNAPDAPDEPEPPDDPPEEVPFSAKFDCGDSFELSPNEILYPKICNVLVKGYNNSDEPVRVTVTYDNSILRVFPDDQSAQPYLMYPSTAGPHSGYYVFSINFSTTSTAPAGETSAIVIVRQGSSEVRFPLTILVLPPGQEPSSGTGIRPPAEVATGSAGDSPDAYCVWRYKSFGDRPECFNFVRAECDTPRYSSSRYELVGSGMTRMESAARMAELGSYHDDAYGCHTSTRTDDGTDGAGPEDNGVTPDGTEQEPTTGQMVRTVSALNITPGSVTLKIGNSQSFTAMAVFSDGSTEVATGPQWSGYEGVADNTFTANEPGNFTITAKYQGISGSASITVAEPVPTAIEISPRNSTIKINKTVDFTATVTFDDGHTETNPDGLTWNPGNSFTGNEAGEYTITAEYGGKSVTATVIVQDFYGKAKAALQACGFEKARSLIDQMLAGPKKTELELEYEQKKKGHDKAISLFEEARSLYSSCKYEDTLAKLQDAMSKTSCDNYRDFLSEKIAKTKAAKALEDNLKAMVDQARNDYKSCNYDEALAILNTALSQAKCSKHIESLKNKITMAENRKAYEETTQRLHEEAKSLYKREDYDGALAKLQQAYNHTKCDRYKDSLSSMIAKVQGKRKPSPEEQVAALDCSHYGEAEGYWNESEKKAKCKCKSGYKPSGNRCAPTRETLVQNLDCSVYPNTYAAWSAKNNRAECFCLEGYKWTRDGGCKSGSVQPNPMCPAAVYAIKNKLRSGDNTGLTLLATNAKSMGCTDPVIDQVLSGGGTGGGGQGGGGTGDCSQCSVYENWLKKNARACGYHGNRLPSICDLDPECIRWNKECNRVKKQLRECLAQCQNR